jgi:WD40 repeat protein
MCAEGEILAVEDHGSLLAIGKNSGEVEVWNYSENRKLWSSNVHKGPVSAVAISSDGSMLATAGLDNSIDVHLASSGEFLASDGSFTGDLLDLTFSGMDIDRVPFLKEARYGFGMPLRTKERFMTGSSNGQANFSL